MLAPIYESRGQLWGERRISTSEQMMGGLLAHGMTHFPCGTPLKYCTALAYHDLIRVPDAKSVLRPRHHASFSEIIHLSVPHSPVHPRLRCHTAHRPYSGSQETRGRSAESFAPWLRSPWDVWRDLERRSGIA